MQYVDFVKRLGKVGIVLINTRDENGKPLNLVNADVETLSVLTEEQIDALQEAIDDVERSGRESVTVPEHAPNLPDESSTLSWVEWLDGLDDDEPMLASKSLFEGLANEAHRDGQAKALRDIDALALPVPVVVESLDAAEWARAAFNIEAPHGIPMNSVWLAGWFALAIEAGRQANRVRGLNSDDDAVAFDVPEVNAVEFVMADGGKVWVNVDGRCRLRAGATTTVIVENAGNREVLRNAVNGG